MKIQLGSLKVSTLVTDLRERLNRAILRMRSELRAIKLKLQLTVSRNKYLLTEKIQNFRTRK